MVALPPAEGVCGQGRPPSSLQGRFMAGNATTSKANMRIAELHPKAATAWPLTAMIRTSLTLAETSMALDRKLLDVLCCPISKLPVQPLKGDKLRRLNQAVEAGELRYQDGETVAETLNEALITDNGARVYRVDDGIPIMLEDRAIPVEDLHLK